jgi:hypothetical protein
MNGSTTPGVSQTLYPELLKLHLHLVHSLPAEDWDLMYRITTEKVLHVADNLRARHCRKFLQVHKAQHPPDSSMTHPPKQSPIGGGSFPCPEQGSKLRCGPQPYLCQGYRLWSGKRQYGSYLKRLEEIRQETVRILKGSHQPNDNVTGAERRALRSLKANGLFTVLPADRGNAPMVLGASDYNQKIATLLEDSAYTKLKKDPTDSVELKTSEDVPVR